MKSIVQKKVIIVYLQRVEVLLMDLIRRKDFINTIVFLNDKSVLTEILSIYCYKLEIIGTSLNFALRVHT